MAKHKKKSGDENEKKIKVSTLIYAILIILMLGLAVASILAFGTSTRLGANLKAKIAKIVPFPAAIINWQRVVFASDVEANLASVQKFYATQNFASAGLRVDFTTEDGQKRLKIKEREILDKLVEDQIIQILAKQKGVKIADADMENLVQEKLKEFGTTEDVQKDLTNSYGWSMADFKKRVVMPALYTQALSEKVLAENGNTKEAKAKIEKAQQELESGKDFVEVVRSYSQGTSKEQNGELGWVSKDQVLPELQEVLFNESSSFKKNNVIESSIGFHILDIENSKTEDDVDYLQLRQIFVSKNTFVDWLERQKKQMDVNVPMKDFVWNKETGSIDFADEAMRKFEKESREKVQGDASIML